MSRFPFLIPCLMLSLLEIYCSGTTTIRVPLSTIQLDSMVTLADSLFDLGDVASASRLYETARDRSYNTVRVLKGLGRVALASREWGDALSIAAEISRIDSSDLTSTLLAAMAHRERGISQVLHVDWSTSRKEFERILARDSSYEDVLYQFALLERYRDDYTRAITLGERQLARKPEMVPAQVGVHRLYRFFVALVDSEVSLSWLRVQAGERPLYYYAEVLRRNKVLTQAESILVRLAENGLDVPPAACYLSLARIRSAAGDPGGAERWYTRALNELESPIGAALLFEDIKYIVTDQELVLFRSLRNIGEQRDFFRSFWNFRNPMPASGTNPRLREHLHRYLLAEERYEYYGFRLWFNNPDRMLDLQFPAAFSQNEEFNDMGVVYLRHGEPGEVIRAMGGFDVDPSQSWLYSGTVSLPRLIFHFQKHNAAGNNWRLTSVPQNPQLIDDLQMWDVKYRYLLSENTFDRNHEIDRMRDESREVVTYALTTEHHTWESNVEPLIIPHAVDVFRRKGGRGLLDISYAIPLAPIAGLLDETQRPVKFEIGFALTDSRSRRSRTKLDTLVLPLSAKSAGYYVDLMRYTVPADSYAVAMHVRQPGGNQIGTWQENVRVHEDVAGELALSSMQFLFPSSEKSELEIDGVKVRQSPFSRYNRTQPLYVYFQIYNLVKDDFGRTAYVTEYLFVPIGEQSDDDGEQLLRREKQGTDETTAEFQQLQPGSLSAGVYRLVARVTDKKRVATVRAERLIELR